MYFAIGNRGRGGGPPVIPHESTNPGPTNSLVLSLDAQQS